jgi:hypothetical protein
MTETLGPYATGLNRRQIVTPPLRFDLAMDAPADYEEAMASVPRFSTFTRLCILLLVAVASSAMTVAFVVAIARIFIR